VHDGLNDNFIEWDPEWAASYREYSAQHDEGVVEWDGALLDGWIPLN